jgi:hypothetical protein
VGATKEARPLLGNILPRGELKAHQNGRHLKPKPSLGLKRSAVLGSNVLLLTQSQPFNSKVQRAV